MLFLCPTLADGIVLHVCPQAVCGLFSWSKGQINQCTHISLQLTVKRSLLLISTQSHLQQRADTHIWNTYAISALTSTQSIFYFHTFYNKTGHLLIIRIAVHVHTKLGYISLQAVTKKRCFEPVGSVLFLWWGRGSLQHSSKTTSHQQCYGTLQIH